MLNVKFVFLGNFALMHFDAFEGLTCESSYNGIFMQYFLLSSF